MKFEEIKKRLINLKKKKMDFVFPEPFHTIYNKHLTIEERESIKTLNREGTVIFLLEKIEKELKND